MRRWLRIRLLFVLVVLLLVPAFALPFAERIRTAWTRYWEPETEEVIVESFEIELSIPPGLRIYPIQSPRGSGQLIVPAEPEVEPEIGVDAPL